MAKIVLNIECDSDNSFSESWKASKVFHFVDLDAAKRMQILNASTDELEVVFDRIERLRKARVAAKKTSRSPASQRPRNRRQG